MHDDLLPDAPLKLFGLDAFAALALLRAGGFKLAVASEEIRREPAVEAYLLDTPGLSVAIVGPGESVDDIGFPAVALLVPDAGPEGTAVRRPGTDVTLVAAGAGVADALSAADLLAREHGVDAEVVELRRLAPLDLAPVFASVARTNRCVVVEVGRPVGGLGAVVATAVTAAAFDDLDGPVARAEGERSGDERSARGRAILAAVLDLR